MALRLSNIVRSRLTLRPRAPVSDRSSKLPPGCSIRDDSPAPTTSPLKAWRQDESVPVHLSHVIGPTNEPLLNTTLGAFFEDSVAAHGDREHLVVRHQGVRWSWNELNQRVDSFAKALVDLGFSKGDRLGVWLPNVSEWVLAQWATAKLGLVLVNINPAYRLSELEHALNLVGVKGLMLTPQVKSSNYVEMIRSIIPELDGAISKDISSARVPSLKHVINVGEDKVSGMYRMADLLPEAGTEFKHDILPSIMASLDPDDPINIQFTSGTTGRPKGATLTHRNILNNGNFVGKTMRLSREDVLCIPVPLYHCFGLVIGNLAAATAGSKIVYPSPTFDPLAVLETVEDEKCTALHGVPTMFIAELEHPRFREFDLTSLRTGVMAGSSCPIEVMKRVNDDMHMPEVTICYGMTETSPVSFQSACDTPRKQRVETIGQIHPHVECKVVDEHSVTVPVNSAGELCTKGYSVMKGYWEDEVKTRECIDASGWMHTGDLAVIDDEGYCRIVGRMKDMIIRGGENIYPREVEEFLFTHPDVEDVQVVGVPDHRMGEAVCCWIKVKSGRKPSAEDIRAYCSGQISHFKIPQYVMFKEAFPMTISGKPQKYIMRDVSIEELGLEG